MCFLLGLILPLFWILKNYAPICIRVTYLLLIFIDKTIIGHMWFSIFESKFRFFYLRYFVNFVLVQICSLTLFSPCCAPQQDFYEFYNTIRDILVHLPFYKFFHFFIIFTFVPNYDFLSLWCNWGYFDCFLIFKFLVSSYLLPNYCLNWLLKSTI